MMCGTVSTIYNVSQLICLRYSSVLKQKLVQTSNSLIGEALDLVKIHQFLSIAYLHGLDFSAALKMFAGRSTRDLETSIAGLKELPL